MLDPADWALLPPQAPVYLAAKTDLFPALWDHGLQAPTLKLQAQFRLWGRRLNRAFGANLTDQGLGTLLGLRRDRPVLAALFFGSKRRQALNRHIKRLFKFPETAAGTKRLGRFLKQRGVFYFRSRLVARVAKPALLKSRLKRVLRALHTKFPQTLPPRVPLKQHTAFRALAANNVIWLGYSKRRRTALAVRLRQGRLIIDWVTPVVRSTWNEARAVNALQQGFKMTGAKLTTAAEKQLLQSGAELGLIVRPRAVVGASLASGFGMLSDLVYGMRADLVVKEVKSTARNWPAFGQLLTTRGQPISGYTALLYARRRSLRFEQRWTLTSAGRKLFGPACRAVQRADFRKSRQAFDRWVKLVAQSAKRVMPPRGPFKNTKRVIKILWENGIFGSMLTLAAVWPRLITQPQIRRALTQGLAQFGFGKKLAGRSSVTLQGDTLVISGEDWSLGSR